MTYDDVLLLDKHDPIANKRLEFNLPEDCIYLDGNSLGALPKAAQERAQDVVSQQWGVDLIQSWNKHQWIDLPTQVGEKIAPLIGAAPGQVICCDSISINLFKLLCSALQMQVGRSVVLSTQDNFPTDLYMVQGLSDLLGAKQCQLQLVDEAQIVDAFDESIAVLLLTQVNFRSGKLLDMEQITRMAHEKGILVIWDLAHSAGALPVELDACKADFAVGCGYKYLNGGPGAPAFLYAAQRHHAQLKQPLSGWMGHQTPFSFVSDYHPSEGVQKYLCGTPSIISMSVLDAALNVFDKLDIRQLREKSIGLSELFISLLDHKGLLLQLPLISHFDGKQRGSQLSFEHPHAYSICQALIDHGVVSDFRAPDILRFGFTPLYTSFEDIWQAVELINKILVEESYKDGKYKVIQKVT
jgi:kynureninase